jgi:hypothetical protein
LQRDLKHPPRVASSTTPPLHLLWRAISARGTRASSTFSSNRTYVLLVIFSTAPGLLCHCCRATPPSSIAPVICALCPTRGKAGKGGVKQGAQRAKPQFFGFTPPPPKSLQRAGLPVASSKKLFWDALWHNFAQNSYRSCWGSCAKRPLEMFGCMDHHVNH